MHRREDPAAGDDALALHRVGALCKPPDQPAACSPAELLTVAGMLATGFTRVAAAVPAALHNKHMRRLTVAQLVSSFGAWTATVATGWWVLQTTGSATAGAGLAAATAVPFMLVTLLGADLSDRVPLKPLLAVLFTLRSLTVLLSVAVVAGALPLTVMVAANILGGLLSAVTTPAMAAVLPEIGSDDERASAGIVQAGVAAISRLAGPAVGGALVAGAGAHTALAVNAASYLAIVAVVLTLPLRTRLPRRAKVAGRARVQQTAAGFSFIWTGTLRKPFCLWIATVWLVHTSALLPVVTRDGYSDDPQALGLMFTATGVGSLLTVVLAALLVDTGDVRGRLVLAPVITAVGMLLLAASISLPAGAAGCALIGSGMSLLHSTYTGEAYRIAPRAVAGRVRGAAVCLMDGVGPILAVALALAADHTSGPAVLAACALALLAAAATASTLWRSDVPHSEPENTQHRQG